MKLETSIAAAALLSAPAILLQDTQQDKKPQDASFTAPKPGPEHESLKKMTGTWDAGMKQGDKEYKAVEERQMECSGLWLMFQFRCDNFMGAPFRGFGAMSYSPDEKKYVLT